MYLLDSEEVGAFDTTFHFHDSPGDQRASAGGFLNGIWERVLGIDVFTWENVDHRRGIDLQIGRGADHRRGIDLQIGGGAGRRRGIDLLMGWGADHIRGICPSVTPYSGRKKV